MKDTVWFTGVALADAKTTTIPILPIGTFTLDRYGKLELNDKVIDELIANFDAKTLKTDVRIDFEHDFREAAGWITALSKGEFDHPVTGDPVPALFATVEWTAAGEKVLGEKTYRYVSAAFGPYKDEESGTKYKNVLKAVALTNDPAMKMLPAVELSDDVRNAPMLLGDVVDKVSEEHGEELPRDLWAAAWGIWPATSAFEELVREALTDGLTGDALKARVAELAADLPEALFEAIKQAVANEKDAPSIDTPDKPVAPTDPTLSDNGDAPDAQIIPTSTAKGGTMEPDVKLAEVEAERDAALKELNDRKATERKSRVDAVLATLSIDEASRKGLEQVLLSDGGEVLLSEGAEPMDREDALLSVLENIVIVPEGEKVKDEQPNPALEGTELSAETQQVATMMNVEIRKEA